MLCCIVSENKNIIPSLIHQVKSSGMEYVLFYNSIVALTHLNLYRPDVFVIESSAFSFISFQSFVDRYQLYDSSLASLLILTEDTEHLPLPIRRENLFSKASELGSVLASMKTEIGTRIIPSGADIPSASSAFFFSGSPYEANASLPEFSIFFIRIKVCLYSGKQNEIIDVLDRLFYIVNAFSDYGLFREICTELNTLFSDARQSLPSKLDSIEIIDFELYQDVFQALNSYKKLFYTLCRQLTEHFSNKVPALVRVIDYISDNFTEPLSLEVLSRQSHFNPSYLSHLFKQELGIGVATYINIVKIHRACKLLESTNLSVAEIAELSGFNDPKYFARLFSQEANLSPSSYRKKFSIFAKYQRGGMVESSLS